MLLGVRFVIAVLIVEIPDRRVFFLDILNKDKAWRAAKFLDKGLDRMIVFVRQFEKDKPFSLFK